MLETKISGLFWFSKRHKNTLNIISLRFLLLRPYISSAAVLTDSNFLDFVPITYALIVRNRFISGCKPNENCLDLMSILLGYLGPNKLLNSPKVATCVVLGYENTCADVSNIDKLVHSGMPINR